MSQVGYSRHAASLQTQTRVSISECPFIFNTTSIHSRCVVVLLSAPALTAANGFTDATRLGLMVAYSSTFSQLNLINFLFDLYCTVSGSLNGRPFHI